MGIGIRSCTGYQVWFARFEFWYVHGGRVDNADGQVSDYVERPKLLFKQ